MKRFNVFLIAVLVALGTAEAVSSISFKPGYHRGLGREKATLVLTLDTREGIRDEKDVTGIVETACLATGLPFLEDDHHKSEVDSTSATPRLKKDWNNHCKDRPDILHGAVA